MSINEEEAEIVKYVFKRYCEGAGSTIIARELRKLGYKSPKGEDKWAESTVRGIIRKIYRKCSNGKNLYIRSYIT